MLNYILKRLLQMIPTVIGVIMITFVLFNILPNDLALISLGKNVTPKQLDEFDEKRGLNRPLFFGSKATSRAYQDSDLSEGAGRWNTWSNAYYSAEKKIVTIEANTSLNPLAFELKPGTQYEWKLTYRGSAKIAGKELAANKWKTEKIRFDGGDDPFFRVGADAFELKALRFRKMLPHPFGSQLTFFAVQLWNRDLGYSETFKQPVGRLLLEGIPKSLSLTVPIFFVSVITSVSLALVCAFFRNTWIDRSLVIFSVALMSINYIVYIVAGQYFLAYKLGWFPVWGYESWRYLVLPVTIGVVSGLGASVRFYRTVMLDEMYKDYVRTAFAKGVSKPRVLFVHVLKNAMIPIITNVVIQIPFLYTGSLLLESFFGIPGLGYLGIQAIMQSDVDVVRALVLIGALLFVLSNLLTDICYAMADPRVKLK